ncbi:MAG: hypothetical protein ACOCW2_02605 [Chitinivibrionales bacterium]
MIQSTVILDVEYGKEQYLASILKYISNVKKVTIGYDEVIVTLQTRCYEDFEMMVDVLKNMVHVHDIYIPEPA